MKIIDVSQFDEDLFKNKDFNLSVKQIGDGKYGLNVKNVEESEKPTKGSVWLKEGDKGQAVIYKTNYDSGD